MPRLQHADDVACLHEVAGRYQWLDRLDGGEHLTLPHRDDRPIDDDPGEVHDAAHDSANLDACAARCKVDPAVPDAVGGRRGEERPHHDALAVDRPDPACRRSARRGERRGTAPGDERERGDQGDSRGQQHRPSIDESAASASR